MLKRTIVGVILIVLLGAVLWLDWWLEFAAGGIVFRGLPLAVLVVVLIAAGYVELSRLSAGGGLTSLGIGGMVCAIIVGTLPFWRQAVAADGAFAGDLTLVVLAAAVMVLFAEQIIRYRTADVMRRMGASVLAVCYLGVCGAVVLGIRMQFGVKALVLFLVAVKAADIGAYFTGSAIGRHKMIPWLSPGKSWEGLLGGMALAAGVAVAFVAVFGPVFVVRSGGAVGPGGTMGLLAAAIFAAVLAIFGQAADMCESAMKRSAGLKDAGTAVPSMGGVLDVLDSPLLAAPAGYVMLAALV